MIQHTDKSLWWKLSAGWKETPDKAQLFQLPRFTVRGTIWLYKTYLQESLGFLASLEHHWSLKQKRKLFKISIYGVSHFSFFSWFKGLSSFNVFVWVVVPVLFWLPVFSWFSSSSSATLLLLALCRFLLRCLFIFCLINNLTNPFLPLSLFIKHSAYLLLVFGPQT